MDENSLTTTELTARMEAAAIDHPLSTDMRDYIRVAIARLRAYDRHQTARGAVAAEGDPS